MDVKKLKEVKIVCVALFVGVFLAACSGEQDALVQGDTANDNIAKTDTLKIVSVFPTTLTTVGTNAPVFAKNVEEVTGGQLKMKLFEPGALVPALQSIPSVSKGSIDAAWASPGFYAGTDSAFSFFTAVPFGPEAGEYLAWMYNGGGLELMNELFGDHNMHAIPCGIMPPEASGWFREEIQGVEDLKGMKMRFFGLGAKVMEKLGVATQLLAPGDIFPALQLGTIDATEFANPTMDLKFGFYQVAKYYYFPGWHQPASLLTFIVNLDKWGEMAPQHKLAIELGCGHMVSKILAEGEATQWGAMKEMRDKHGVQIKRWPPEVLAVYENAWKEVIEEESVRNPNFAKVYKNYSTFRENYALWLDYGYLR